MNRSLTVLTVTLGSIVAAFLLVFIGIFGVRTIENSQTRKHTKAIDQAREEYEESLKTIEITENIDSEYVKAAVVTLRKEGYVEADTREHRDDRHAAEVQMDESFNDLPLKQRCTICLNIMEEIESYLDYAYRHSDYYRLFKNYVDERLGLMDYGKGKLGIGRSFEFTFDDGTSTYEFPHQSFGYDMVMDGVKYSLVISSGQVQAVVEAQTDRKGNSSYSGTGTTTSTGTKPSGSGTYDPYDAGDYDNAEDFADDHYEDFYDYEDNYEDEDEAYDAAEEYWEDY